MPRILRTASGTSTAARRVPDAATVTLALALAAYVVLATWQIELPGLNYDELIQLTPALAFVKGGLSSSVDVIPKSELHLFGHSLPLMILPYLGAVKTIAFVPVAASFGISAESVRIFSVTVGAAALVATYGFARTLFPRSEVAALGAVLLATDPSFVFYSRVDFAPTVFMLLLKGIALWALCTWWRSGRTAAFVVGAFALGVGVYDKTDFLWVVAAILAAALVIDPRQVRRRLLRRGVLIAGTTAFAIGCLPLIVYNLSWPPRTIVPSLEGKLHLRYGSGSGNPVQELWNRLVLLPKLLDGERVSRDLGGVAYGRPLLPIVVALAAALIAALYFRRRSRSRPRGAFFVLLCGIFVLVGTALTPGGGGPQHVLLVYPFPHLVLAAALVEVADWARSYGRPAARVVLASVLVPAVVGIATVHATLSQLDRTGGSGNFSSGIYALNGYLLEHDRHRTIVEIDWGMHHNLVGLSDGKLHSLDLWLPLNEPGTLRGSLREQLLDAESRYVLHARPETNFERPRQRFFDVVARARKRARLETTISTRDGRPLFEVYRVTP
jgi:Dolichyl-phosphate-mannose-protein mannosyltransferase